MRDYVREKLQARQESQVDLSSGAEQLFKHITTTTLELVFGKPGYEEKKARLRGLEKNSKKDQTIEKGFTGSSSDIAAAQLQPQADVLLKN